MTRKVEVILWNAEGCMNELFGGFSDFPHTVKVRKGQKIKIALPVTCRLAEYRMLVIRKNENGDSIPTGEDRRSEEEIKEMRKSEAELNDDGHVNYPHSTRTRRGVLD